MSISNPLEKIGIFLDEGKILEASESFSRLGYLKNDSWQYKFQLGRFFEATGQFEKASKRYKEAVRFAPEFIPARLAYARLQTKLGNFDDAMRAYSAIINRSDSTSIAWRELCRLHGKLRNFQEAYECILKLINLNEDAALELSEYIIGSMHICDWRNRGQALQNLEFLIETGAKCFVDPFALLASFDNPTLHFKMAKCIAPNISISDQFFNDTQSHQINEPKERRLKIGYLCGDFNEHPMSILMAGILERHDCKRFEITIFDYSDDDRSSIRQRIMRASEHFCLIKSLGPYESAQLIASKDIDILIDLKGYTKKTRSEILAFRPAPLQVNFLGYVGTLGADWVDYVIADKHVLPLSEQVNWVEKIIHMPDCYYPNDRSRPIPSAPTAEGRSAHGLPETGFVFVCFNNNYKITPELFGVWMQILTDIPDSVLWLYEGNQFVKANLRSEAKKNQINEERLIFAPHAPFSEHIDRYAYGDLFLDTTPYGAHTTACDALWAGLPVITLMGSSFASRVGASLLSNVGLTELVCYSAEEYRELAVKLARNPALLNNIKHTLRDTRMTSSLFDAAEFTKNFENLLENMMLTLGQNK